MTTEERYTITIMDNGVYIRIRLHAPITRELARQFSMDVKQVDDEIDSKGFLFDMRGIANVSSVLDNYEFAYRDMAEMGLSKRKRSAILINLTEDTHDFPETVMRNAGYNVYLFSNEQEAIAWLKGV